jgi:polysaccharide pyruvyl transferase CsaB
LTLSVSEKVRILVIGYYGHSNLGDELLAEAVKTEISRIFENASVVLASSSGEPGTVGRFSPALLAELVRSDAVVFGGGGLFNDYTLRSLIYYLSFIPLARILGKKTMIFGCGIGPLENPRARVLAARLFPMVDSITVRDTHSADILYSLGEGTRSVVTADPVFLLNDPVTAGARTDGPSRRVTDAAAGTATGKNAGAPVEAAREASTGSPAGLQSFRPRVVFVLRDWPDRFARKAALGVLESVLARPELSTALLPIGGECDVAFAKKVAKEMGENRIEIFPPPRDFSEALERVRGSSAVVAMRLHGAILPMIAGVPVIGLAYDPKVRGLFTDAGLAGLCFELDMTGQAKASSALFDILNDRERYAEKVRAAATLMARRARGNTVFLSRLLSGGTAGKSATYA